MNPEISIVIPLFNEEETFDSLITRLNSIQDSSDREIEIVIVDDGSSDKTAELLENLSLIDTRYHGVFLSRNFGHQKAFLSGLSKARGAKAVMLMDGDLQDPPELISEFHEKIEQGFDIVYAIRKNRKENFLKKLSYTIYYRLQKIFVPFPIPLDSGDFSMLSRRAVNIMLDINEKNIFLRGLRAWIGLKQTGIEYDREGRYAGKTKYSLAKLIQLGLNGIFNFSYSPLKVITYIGISSFSLGFFYLMYALSMRILYNSVPEGFISIVFLLFFLSGIQMISIGLIGEYLARILEEVRNRPSFVIDKIIVDGVKKDG
jgi:dolichol-phosphate mannosyltransferase